MATKKIGASIVLEGEKSYREALKGIRTEQSELRSEMKLCNEQFKESQNSLEALKKKHDILASTLELQQKKVESTREVLEQANEAQSKAAQKVEELKKAYENAQKAMQSLENDSNATNEDLNAQKEIMDSLKSQLTLAEQGYSKVSEKVTNYQTALNYAEAEMAITNRELEKTDTYMAEAEKSTDKCATSIDEYGKEVLDASEKTSVFGDVLKANLLSDVILNGIKKLASGVKQMADSAIDTGESFEASMSQVAATMGITVEEIQNGSEAFEKLKKAAKECGETTMFSASEAADALNYLALAGYDAEKAVETLPKVLTLAAAGNIDLATASDMVTDAMAALGMETSELDTFIDEMAKTSQKSNTSVAQLGEATLVCAGTVTMAGQNIEVMNTALGVLANNGIKGSEAGTKLRNILLSLTAPTDNAAQAIEELGLNVTNADGSVRDLNDIMSDLNKLLDGMSDTQKTQVINKIFNKTDISAVNALLKSSNGEFESLINEIENATGAADAMASTLQDNLKGKLTILQSSLEGLGIASYEIFEDIMKDSVDSATDAVGRLQDSISDGEMGVSLRKLASSVGDFTEEAIELAEKVLPAMIDGLSWVLDNAGTIASGVAGIAAAHAMYTTIIPTLTSLVEAYKTYKTVTEGATVAQAALNAIAGANPYVLLASAITGVAVALGTMSVLSTETESEIEKFTKSVEESVNAINDQVSSHKNEITSIKNLSAELLTLNRQEILTNDEQARMNFLVDELNTIMPDLNLQLDEQGHLIGLSADELERYCDLSIKSYQIELMKEDMTEIMREHYELQKEYNAALEENARISADIEELMNSVEESGGEWSISQLNQLDDLEAALNDSASAATIAQENMTNLESEYQEMVSSVETLTAEVEDQTAALEENEKKAAETATTIVQYGNTNIEVTHEIAQEWEEVKEAYGEALEKANESITGQVSLFEKLEVASDLSTKDMVNNIQSQTNTYTQYTEDLVKATDLMEKDTTGSFSQIVQGIIDMGVDGAGYLHELVTAAETDSDSFNSVLEEFAEMRDARTTLETTMADIQTGYSDWVAANLGIQTDFNKSVTENAEGAMSDVDNTISDGIQDLADTIDENAPLVSDASGQMTNDMIGAVNTSLGLTEDGKYQSMLDTGTLIAQSMADGITENALVIAEAMQSAVDDAADNLDMTHLKNQIDRAIGDALD
ncbi:MAG: phage tail tape measure protein [Bacilli bacterium]|nr:phage tail tape measure protein [Bacilli bacterium]